MNLDDAVPTHLLSSHGPVFCLKRGIHKIRYWDLEKARYINLVSLRAKIDCLGFHHYSCIDGVIEIKTTWTLRKV